MRKLAPAAVLGLALVAAPLAAQAPAPGGANPAPTQDAGAIPPPAPARAPRQSWTADRREFTVGDVITVLIDEQTLATANHDNSAIDRRARAVDLHLRATAASAKVPGVGADFDSRNDALSQQRGDALRATRFTGEMSLRVVAVEPGGRLRVEGTKVVNVDRSRQEVALRGWVRAQDVSAANLVDSWRIADAEIVYNSSGSLGRPKAGILGRVMGVIWP